VNKGQVVFHTYKGLGRVLAALPEPVAFVLADVAGDILFRTRPEQRRMIANNLRRVIGAEATDVVVLDRWARRAFRAYARYWVEGARLATTSATEVEAHTFVQGFEHLEEGMASGRGVLMVLPHVGSWEYGGAFLATRQMPMTSVAERIEPPELFEYFVEQRAAMGLTVVPLDEASGRSIQTTLRAGGLVGLLSDRDIAGNGIEVEFFGETTTMPAGPAMLALRTGATLVTGAVYTGPGRGHRAVVDPPIDTARRGSFRSDVARLTQEIATRMELLIRVAPEQWHVFQPLWISDRSEQAA
jgi:lauroyl/myristoyl acyltransferase